MNLLNKKSRFLFVIHFALVTVFAVIFFNLVITPANAATDGWHIKDDATGGECSVIGTWDATTKTCTLSQDLSQGIIIDSNNIILDGSGRTITGSNTGNGVYLLSRTGVTIKNLNIDKFNYGILLWWSSNNTMTDNTASNNNSSGISLHSSRNNTLTGNTASNNRYGISLYDGSSNTLIGNTASNNSMYGISIEAPSNTMTDNTASNNTIGIDLSYYSRNNTLTDNIAQENSYYDLRVRGDTTIDCSNTITNTTGSGGRPIKYFNNAVNLSNETLSGLILCNADGSNIHDITIDGSATKQNNGLVLIRTDSSTIANVNSSNNYTGIQLHSSTGNTLTSNTASNNYTGIQLHSSTGNTLTGNTASNNGGTGIYLQYSNYNTLTSNTASNNSTGIWIYYSNYNTITDNTANSNDGYYGISISYSSSNNIVTGNTASNNRVGIAIYGSSSIYGSQPLNNQTYKNNFIGNTTQVFAISGSGVFNLASPIGGNYWSNYDEPLEGCNDLNQDNFCDSPYIFSGGPDNLPWTKKDGWLTPQNNLIVEFEQTPLFIEANFVPGDDVSRWIKVTNNSDQTQRIAVEAINTSDPDRLGDVLNLEIKENGVIRYNNTLSNFFANGEVYLSDLANGTQTQYDFIVTFYSGAGNLFQGKSLGFDILIGFQGVVGELLPSAGGGYFSDTETNTGNTFSAGTWEALGPYIISIIPAPNGAPGVQRTITGEHFTNSFTLFRSVYFGDAQAEIISWQENEIVVKVPPGTGEVDIRVSTLTSESNKFSFAYNEPFIDALQPEVGDTHTQVKIQGQDFGIKGLSSLFGVKFGKSNALTTVWEDNEIQAKPPSDYGTGENDHKFLVCLGTATIAGLIPNDNLTKRALEKCADWLLTLADGIFFKKTSGELMVDVKVTTPVGESNTKTFTYNLLPLIWGDLNSPGELQIHDSQGHVSGLAQGEIREEIPASLYDLENEIIMIPEANDQYSYKVVGTGNDTYGLNLIFAEQATTTVFQAMDIPIKVDEVHKYSVDWETIHLNGSGVILQIDADGNGIFEKKVITDSTLTQNEFILQTETNVDIAPDILNLKSKGNVITAYIELPHGFMPDKIGASTIMLNGIIPSLEKPVAFGDYDNDGVVDLMVKFDREKVERLFLNSVEKAEMRVSGKVFYDGEYLEFAGVDYIRLIK